MRLSWQGSWAITDLAHLLVPGTLWKEYHEEVGKIMTSELLGLGLLDKADVLLMARSIETQRARELGEVVDEEGGPGGQHNRKQTVSQLRRNRQW